MAQASTRRNRPYAARMAPEERREQLLDVVLDLIDTDGVGAVSMDAVARRAGVTRPVVYSVFTDADDLLRGSLRREERRALDQVTHNLDTPSADARVENMHQLFAAYLNAVIVAPQRWRAIYMVADSDTPALRNTIDRARTLLTGLLLDRLKNPSSTRGQIDSELLAHHLASALWDSGRLLLTRPDEFGHDRLLSSLDHLAERLLQ